jgi:N utilization substance protein B
MYEMATVPGALEIPLACRRWRKARRFDALIALGAVIRGETYHFEIVANDSCRALMEVQLDSGVPIANGILTCEDDDQALARMQQKGIRLRTGWRSRWPICCVAVGSTVRAMTEYNGQSPSRAERAGRAAARSPRRRAREFGAAGALPVAVSAATTKRRSKPTCGDVEGFDKADREFFVKTAARRARAARRRCRSNCNPSSTVPFGELSPIEACVLLAGAFELRNYPQTPYRVIINEVDRAGQGFGGTDGHKYVNGVLDKLAVQAASGRGRGQARGERQGLKLILRALPGCRSQGKSSRQVVVGAQEISMPS